MTKQQQWHEILKAHYGVALSDTEAMIWFEELTQMRATNTELCDAIRSASDDSLKPGEKRYYPTIIDLKHWVLRKRTSEHKESDRDFTSVELRYIAELRPQYESGAMTSDDVRERVVRMPSRSVSLIEKAFFAITGSRIW